MYRPLFLKCCNFLFFFLFLFSESVSFSSPHSFSISAPRLDEISSELNHLNCLWRLSISSPDFCSLRTSCSLSFVKSCSIFLILSFSFSLINCFSTSNLSTTRLAVLLDFSRSGVVICSIKRTRNQTCNSSRSFCSLFLFSSILRTSSFHLSSSSEF